MSSGYPLGVAPTPAVPAGAPKPSAGYPEPAAPVAAPAARVKTGRAISTRQVLALIGAAVLFIGAFCPIISVPIPIVGGDFNYFQIPSGPVKGTFVTIGQMAGIAVIVLAIASVLLAVNRWYRGLWVTGAIAAAIPAATYVILKQGVEQAQQQINNVKPPIPLPPIIIKPIQHAASQVVGSISIQWGWAVLLIGAVLLLTAAFLKDNPAPA